MWGFWIVPSKLRCQHQHHLQYHSSCLPGCIVPFVLLLWATACKCVSSLTWSSLQRQLGHTLCLPFHLNKMHLHKGTYPQALEWSVLTCLLWAVVSLQGHQTLFPISHSSADRFALATPPIINHHHHSVLALISTFASSNFACSIYSLPMLDSFTSILEW